MRIIVCGDRTYCDEWLVNALLDGLYENKPTHPFVLIDGGAKGADHWAEEWAFKIPDVEHYIIPADWEGRGKAAGPIRNQEMIEMRPDLVIAFHDDIEKSKGTKDMIYRAKKAGIPTYLVAKQ